MSSLGRQGCGREVRHGGLLAAHVPSVGEEVKAIGGSLFAGGLASVQRLAPKRGMPDIRIR